MLLSIPVDAPRASDKNARETNGIADARETNGIADARETNEIADARETNEIADARETNGIADARETNGIADAGETNGIADARGASLRRFGAQCHNLSSVIRGIKCAVTKFSNENHFDFAWQPRFYEHVIQNQNELNRIAKYIDDNPRNWSNNH